MTQTDAAGRTGGTVLADMVAASGVDTVFALGGAGQTHFLIALEDRGIRIVGTRHESAAVGAADGYARTTGNIGIAAIIAEQGLPNALSAIQGAYMYGSPVVVLVTRWVDAWLESDGEVAVDLHASLAPITKWVRTVHHADSLGEYMRTAMRIATSGRPGPTVLVMPQDLLAAPAKATNAEVPEPPCPAAMSDAAMQQIEAILADARAPALLVDSGCRGEAAIEGIGALAKDCGLPVFSYGGARGLLAENEDTVLPWPYAQVALPACDVLIVAGARLNMWFGFGRAPRFPEHLKVVQIDAQGEAIGRNRPVDLGVVADPGEALRQLAASLTQKGRRWSTDWLHEALASRREAVAATGKQEGPVHALDLARSVERHRPRGAVVVGDGADVLNWSYGAIRIDRPGGYMDHHPMGAMGSGFPLAIGAAAAVEDIAARNGEKAEPVTLLTGDGAFGFHLAELETAARHSLPLRIVVGNDAQWGTEYHGQKIVTGRHVNTRLSQADFAQVAQGLGVPGSRVDEAADLDTAVGQFFSSAAPALLDVAIDPEAGLALKANPDVSFLVFRDLAPPGG